MSTNKSPNRTHEISIALGGVSPLVFVAAYLISIIVFWGLFLLLPRGSFYHSTAQYEREFLNQDASSILNAIKVDILSNLQVHYGNLKISKNNWVVELSEFQVSSLNVSEYPENISFQVFVPLWYVPPDKQYTQGFLRSTIRLDLKEETFIADRAYYFPPLEDASTINIEGV